MTSSGWIAKVARARQLATDLEHAVETFLDDDPFGVSLAVEGNAGVLRVDRLSDVPEQMALLLGDVVHNARCALDHVTWDLASRGRGTEGRPPSGSDARRVAFPITKDAQAFSQAATFLGRFVPMTALDRIEQLQPWVWAARAWPEPQAPTPQEFETWCSMSPLKRLADLDNADKHRRLSIAVWYPGTVRYGSGRPRPEYDENDIVSYTGPDLEELMKTDAFRRVAALIEKEDAAPETVDFYFNRGPLSEGSEIGRFLRNDRGPLGADLTTGPTSLRLVVEEDGLTGISIGVPAMLEVVDWLLDEVEMSCQHLERD